MPKLKLEDMPVAEFIAESTEKQKNGCIHATQYKTGNLTPYLQERYGAISLGKLVYKEHFKSPPPHYLFKSCGNKNCINPMHTSPPTGGQKALNPNKCRKKGIKIADLKLPIKTLDKKTFWQLDRRGLLDWTNGSTYPLYQEDGIKYLTEIRG